MISSNGAIKLNNENPLFQELQLGTEMKEAQDNGLVCVPISIEADATGAQSFTIPFDMEVIDVVVQARAASASGTATVRKGTTAITDAMVMAVDKVIVRAGTIDDAQSTLLTTDSLNVITNGAADRGLVTLIGYRV